MRNPFRHELRKLAVGLELTTNYPQARQLAQKARALSNEPFDAAADQISDLLADASSVTDSYVVKERVADLMKRVGKPLPTAPKAGVVLKELVEALRATKNMPAAKREKLFAWADTIEEEANTHGKCTCATLPNERVKELLTASPLGRNSVHMKKLRTLLRT